MRFLIGLAVFGTYLVNFNFKLVHLFFTRWPAWPSVRPHDIFQSSVFFNAYSRLHRVSMDQESGPSQHSHTTLGPTSVLQGRPARPNGIPPSFSTPDLSFSPSGSLLSQSISVPSLSSVHSACSLTTSSSFSSVPVSACTSSCSLSSSSHISTNNLPCTLRPCDLERKKEGWFSAGSRSPILPLPAPTRLRYLSTRRKKASLGAFTRLTGAYMHPVLRQLPRSLWDRVVLLVFCVYVVVLFRALLGFGAVAPCPNVVMDSRSRSLQVMRLNHIANDGATISALPDSPILPLPSQLYLDAHPASKQISQDNAVRESAECSEPSV